MKKYQVMGHIVEPFVEFNMNVLILNGVKHEIIWDGNGNGWIIVDGHKRYLEEPTNQVVPLSKCKSFIAGAVKINDNQQIIGTTGSM